MIGLQEWLIVLFVQNWKLVMVRIGATTVKRLTSWLQCRGRSMGSSLRNVSDLKSNRGHWKTEIMQWDQFASRFLLKKVAVSKMQVLQICLQKYRGNSSYCFELGFFSPYWIFTPTFYSYYFNQTCFSSPCNCCRLIISKRLSAFLKIYISRFLLNLRVCLMYCRVCGVLFYVHVRETVATLHLCISPGFLYLTLQRESKIFI